ncbi:hypothetical protein V1478_017469 [Vespula squamosa]|uniref:Uncharacterized protein n=1 Tax=Vespula squamosa TaxID=30214 RepID=A0ABD1ZWX5_VESSQ
MYDEDEKKKEKEEEKMMLRGTKKKKIKRKKVREKVVSSRKLRNDDDEDDDDEVLKMSYPFVVLTTTWYDEYKSVSLGGRTIGMSLLLPTDLSFLSNVPTDFINFALPTDRIVYREYLLYLSQHLTSIITTLKFHIKDKVIESQKLNIDRIIKNFGSMKKSISVAKLTWMNQSGCKE